MLGPLAPKIAGMSWRRGARALRGWRPDFHPPASERGIPPPPFFPAASGDDCSFGRSAQLLFGNAIGQIDNPKPAFDHVQNPQIGDDPIDHRLAG